MTKKHDPIPDFLDDLRRQYEDRLNRYEPDYGYGVPRLREAVRYSLLAGGKRLRPLLTLLAAETADTGDDRGWIAAHAVELVHTYSLIHDDLPAVDNDDYRRGVLTCHRRFDEATAILAGDALLTMAFFRLSELTPEPLSASCMAILSRDALRMVEGQMDDVRRTTEGADYVRQREISDEDFLKQMHAAKTGALIEAALEMGALVRNASLETRKALAVFGQAFGLAFQITDDLLDVLGDEAQVGKKLDKDAAAGKLTFVTLWGVAESRRRVLTEVDRASTAIRESAIGLSSRSALEYLLRQLPNRTH